MTAYKDIENVFDQLHVFGNYLVATNLPIDEASYENL
jgi:hypothetical protein